ncbi:MAG TPA: zf-HC2 domain-containing protein [Vicinamibacteria bacterium]|nr:zf-HC2 domain-containing protein [Vicinamibacteria bacterium]
MTCEELYRRLTDHVEGALGADLCGEVEEHLTTCFACQELRQDLEDLARLCREREPVRLPDDVRGRIEAMLSA